MLKRLFGRGEPAPQVNVHPEDQDLVSEADKKWWRTLTRKDCQTMEEQDNIWKMTAFKYYMDHEGLSEEEAARRVRKSFATYYATLEGRKDEPLRFVGEDAKLPYVLKDRVNRYILSLDPSTVLQLADVEVSTVNALIRMLIRRGMI